VLTPGSTTRRQFALLVRQAIRRLQDAALASRDVDADQFVLWGAALLATPLLFNTVTWTSRYPWLRHRSLEVLHDAVLADRLFFVTWPMLVMCLVGALVWDGLVPDKTDQQVLGVLPVGSRKIAAARLAAAWLTAGVLLAGIVVPPALAYGLAGGAHPSVGPRLGIVVGQAVASFAAGLFAISTLLAIRGALVCVIGGAAAARAAVAFQLLSVVLLVETFLFLPGLMPAAMRAVSDGGALLWAPPVWFLGLYASFAGPRADLLRPLAPLALAALSASVVAAIVVYLGPATWNARRVMEAVEPRRRREWLRRLADTAAVVLRTRPARALFAFAVLSVFRNRRALMTLATYLGLGVALAGTRLLSASVRGRPLPFDQPFDYLLAIPLLLTFFLAFGARAAFSVPNELAANWIIRLAGPREVAAHAPATRLACLAVAVAPVTVLVLGIGTVLWGSGPALKVAAMHAASGAFLVAVVMAGFAAVPFTRAHAMSVSSLKVAAPLGVVAVHLYAFRLDDLQRWALTSPTGPLWYVGLMAVTTLVALWIGRWWYGRQVTTFEAPSDQAVRLRLSEAGQET
jgi:hypothetical protein